MHITKRLSRILSSLAYLSAFDPHSRNMKDLGAECRRFVEKGSFVELRFGSAEGMVKGNEARTGTYKGGAEVSAG